ncbi:hypothetical protein AB0D11_44110 [Streptomyces monashensis]|uniref:hypothetical protein n=1 Tax=Streptomyces monashensis TaxID=1678012 RepID=UPI0033C1A890
MGERLSGGGVPGRRHAQPGGATFGPRDTCDAGALETVLAAAIRQGDPDPRAEQQAVAAFRASHAAGPHRARTRRRDDWRPPEKQRARRPLKLTFGVALASLTLGGVALAAVGYVGSSSHDASGGRATAHPSALAPGRPDDTASSTSSGGPRPTDSPASVQDSEAHCRAYEQVRGGGKALDAKVWQQLVAAAGGKDGVADYCSEQLRRATSTPNRSAGTGKSGKDSAGSGNGATGRTGASSEKGTSGRSRTSGNGTSGGSPGSTGRTGGDGRTSGQGGGKHK